MAGTGSKLTVRSGGQTIKQHRTVGPGIDAVAAFRTGEGQLLDTLGVYAGGSVQRIGDDIGTAGAPHTGQQHRVIGNIGRDRRAKGNTTKNDSISAGVSERDMSSSAVQSVVDVRSGGQTRESPVGHTPKHHVFQLAANRAGDLTAGDAGRVQYHAVDLAIHTDELVQAGFQGRGVYLELAILHNR